MFLTREPRPVLTHAPGTLTLHVSSAQSFFGFDLVNRKVAIPGIGDTPITFTGRPDIARYLGFIFTNLPAEKIKWRAFRLEGERTVRAICIPARSLTTEDEEFSNIIVVQRDI